MQSDKNSQFKQLCDYYEITDFSRQIVNYGRTYREKFEDKFISPQELERSLKEGFYIGHHKTGLGEFLSYTAVPAYLKRFFPGCRVYVCAHRFAEALFRNNPDVDGVGDIAGREPFGTFREFGFGTHAQKRLRGFGIFETQPVSPHVTVAPKLLEKWTAWRSKLPLQGRKLVMVQSSGRTNPKLFSALKWWSLLRSMREEFYFVQIGNLRDQFIWTHRFMLGNYDMEDMAGLLAQGDAFIGPNSGVMHLAASVGVNSVIMHNEATSDEMHLPVLGDNLALPKHVNHHLFHVYPWHHHIMVDSMWKPGVEPGPFALSLTAANLREALRNACKGENPIWDRYRDFFVSEPYGLFS